MHKYLFVIIAFLSSIALAYSQNTIRCNQEERAATAYDNYPAFLKSIDQGIEEFNIAGPVKSSSTIITIPVHVILVHNPGQAIGTGTNFSLEHVQSQIDVINEDFRRLNSDASNTPGEFDAGDSEIEFCLASVDPDGNPTDGITRYATSQNMNSNEFSIKSATGWNRNDYLNIWSAPNLGGTLGWAYLPSTTNLPNPILDGAVCAAGSFGGPGFATNVPYHLGRTVTHEIGHYLGLRHIWRNDGCGADDGFADTPQQDDEYFGCPSHPQQSCGSNDMFMNYMDYVNDNCMNAFSVLQGDYMQTILNTSRSSLLNSANTRCSLTEELTIELIDFDGVKCFGESTGFIEVEANGGEPPLVYSINGNNDQSSGIFEELSAGMYNVMVTDANGNTADLDVFLETNEKLIATVNFIQNNLCAGLSHGSVILQLEGGTAPYYIDGQFAAGDQFLISNLAAGSYTSIILDSESCQTTVQYEISEPFPISIMTSEIIGVSCFGESNGSAHFSVFGGNPGYDIFLNGNEVNDNSLAALPAGDYQLVAVDEFGCQGSTTFEITQPDTLEGSIDELQSITCSGVDLGSVTLAAQGGTQPYSYTINDAVYSDSPTFSGLDAGNYSASIQDDNGCTFETEFTIEAGYEIAIIEENIQNPVCGNDASGSISIQGQGGSEPYSYLLSPSGQSNNTGNFANLAAGVYEVVVADVNGCISSNEWSLVEEAALEVNIESVQTVSCYGSSSGIIEVSSNNGEGLVNYSIDGINFQESGLFNDLHAGTYTVTGVDASGCFSQLVIQVEQNPLINLVSEMTPLSCYNSSDASVLLVASGGVGDFIYDGTGQENTTGLFEDLEAGLYNFVITDNAGCIIQTEIEIQNVPQIEITEITTDSTNCFGQPEGSITIGNIQNQQGDVVTTILNEDGQEVENTMLFAGLYTVLVEDENGCSSSTSAEVDEAEPIQWEILEQTDANCDGSIRGDIQVQAITGLAPYSYAVGQIENTSGYFQNFNAGSYALSITDATLCSRVVQFTIGQTDAFEYSVDELQNVSCFDAMDGSVQLDTEQAGTFTYRLVGETNNTGLFENLGPGIYPFEIEDSTSCVVYDTIEITSPSPLSIVDIEETINVEDLTDLVIDVEGGTTPYEYRLNGGAWQDEAIFIGLENGTYDIDIVDANGCAISTTQIVLEIDLEKSSTWLLYPNPFNETLYLEWIGASQEEIEISLIDVVGQKIEPLVKKTVGAGRNTISLAYGELPSGVYMAVIVVDGKASYQKVVKR